jgi:cysteine-rich repeat protein
VCKNEVCGDRILQKSNQESCDDGNTVSGDGCSAACLLELDKMVFIADERSRLNLQSLVTGAVFNYGDPGFHELADLAFDASGNLFGSTGSNVSLSIGFNGYLVSMAAGGLPDRGAPIGDSGWQALSAIDFHPATGTLYGIALDGTGVSRLITLSPASGATLSVVGDLGLNNAGAMAFDASGVLYVAGRPGTSGGSSLYTVSLSPFSVTPIGPVGAYLLAGIDFAPDGTLYGVTQRGTGADRALVRVNKATGAGTILFGTGSTNQQGIRFAPAIAVDRDLDGIQDAADCSPLSSANAVPGFTSALVFTSTSGTGMTWTAASNSRHSNTYRGTITGPLGLRPPASVFDHTCFESDDSLGDGANVTTDASTPPLGTAYYYVSAGEGCGEGPAGPDASHPMPPLTLCPTPP